MTASCVSSSLVSTSNGIGITRTYDLVEIKTTEADEATKAGVKSEEKGELLILIPKAFSAFKMAGEENT